MREQILDAIHHHWNALGYWPRSGVIARMCDLPSSTTTEMIRRLAQEGLLDYQPYGEIRLTATGRRRLKEYYRHKRLLETLLITELNLTLKMAQDISNAIAMQIPCSVVQRICAKYDHPRQCPGGYEIPSKAKCKCDVIKR